MFSLAAWDTARGDGGAVLGGEGIEGDWGGNPVSYLHRINGLIGEINQTFSRDGQMPGVSRGLSGRRRMNRLRKALSVKVSSLVTTNLPFDEWTDVFGSERLTGGAAGPSHSPRPYPENERRQLPPQGQPQNTGSPSPDQLPQHRSTPTPASSISHCPASFRSEPLRIISVVQLYGATVVCFAAAP